MACPGGTQTNTITTNIWNNLTMVQGTTINGTVTNLVTAITPSDPCYVVNNGYGLVINNARIVNCPCCLLTIKNPPKYSTGKVTVG
jgi:hypothetical protein